MNAKSRFVCVLLAPLLFEGCSKDTRTRYVEVPAPTPAPPPPAPPPLVDESHGQLVSLHTKVLGYGVSDPWEPYAPPGRWLPTPRGVWCWMPQAVEYNPTRANELMDQVARMECEPDTRVPAGTLIPVGTRVIVLPGPFPIKDGRWAVGLAWSNGWENGDRTQSHVAFVSWRGVPSDPRLLPAGPHEARHLITGDPMAGHPGGCCNVWMFDP